MSDDESETTPFLPPPALASRYTSALHEALAVTERAVQSDAAGDAREALRLYALAVALFRQSLADGEGASELRASIPAKIGEYERRIDALQSELRGSGETAYADVDVEFYKEVAYAPRRDGEMLDDFDDPQRGSARKERAPKGRRGERALELALRLAYTAKQCDEKGCAPL